MKDIVNPARLPSIYLTSQGELRMKKQINPLLFIGIIGTLVTGPQFAFHYGKVFWGNRDIWWTPMPLALSLQETANTFKMFINNESLDNHLERGSLFATDKAGQTYRVVPQDIKIGLNNWQAVKASFLHSSIYSAFFLGVSVTLLLLGIGQVLKKKQNMKA